jgi:hypothetical protein
MREDIVEIVQELKIPFLAHFTRFENLASIMALGLLPRDVLENEAPGSVVNDALRLDGRPGFNCLSIAFPNAPMFYRFRQDHPESDWVILLLPPILLAREGVLFCKHNAADNRISGTAECHLTTPEALRGLYEEIPGHPSRTDQRLKPFDPTDVQAEVLVAGLIEAEWIKNVIFPSAAAKVAGLHLIGNRKAHVMGRRGLYATRDYYRTWGAGAA